MNESDPIRLDAKQCVTSPPPPSCLNMVISGSIKLWRQWPWRQTVHRPVDDIMVTFPSVCTLMVTADCEFQPVTGKCYHKFVMHLIGESWVLCISLTMAWQWLTAVALTTFITCLPHFHVERCVFFCHLTPSLTFSACSVTQARKSRERSWSTRGMN